MKNLRRAVLLACVSAFVCTGAEARGGGHSYGGGHSHSYSSRSYSSHSYSHSSYHPSHSHSSYGHVNSHYHWVSGYHRRNGTYVHAYRATDPNGTRNDNYSTRGNTNPWTGEPGTKSRDGE